MNKRILILLILVLLIGCKEETAVVELPSKVNITLADPIDVSVQENHPIAIVEFKNFEPIVIELYPEIAKNTVNNFIELSTIGFYDGLSIHKVVKGFIMQGGDPTGNGTGGPGYTIDSEFYKETPVENRYISHKKGTLSMARAEDVHSAGSQFFIVLEDAEQLDLNYTSFGRVIEGMEVIEQIEAVETENDVPIAPIVIIGITIELNGYEPDEPVKNK